MTNKENPLHTKPAIELKVGDTIRLGQSLWGTIIHHRALKVGGVRVTASVDGKALTARLDYQEMILVLEMP